MPFTKLLKDVPPDQASELLQELQDILKYLKAIKANGFGTLEIVVHKGRVVQLNDKYVHRLDLIA